MTLEKISFQLDESIYKPFEREINEIPISTNTTISYCDFHGEWWFERIGETNWFRCMHANHKGFSPSGKEMGIDPPAKYNNGK